MYFTKILILLNILKYIFGMVAREKHFQQSLVFFIPKTISVLPSLKMCKLLQVTKMFRKDNNNKL